MQSYIVFRKKGNIKIETSRSKKLQKQIILSRLQYFKAATHCSDSEIFFTKQRLSVAFVDILYVLALFLQ